ncbi:hypothetical protein BC629DRAFT_1596700 [Irpex lacteus]|nr:hypothetical protein BC629DRAFT_1596700 [Irpex lacteus]
MFSLLVIMNLNMNTSPSLTTSPTASPPAKPTTANLIHVLFNSSKLVYLIERQPLPKLQYARGAIAAISPDRYVIYVASIQRVRDSRRSPLDIVYEGNFEPAWALSVNERNVEVRWGKPDRSTAEWECLGFHHHSEMWKFVTAFGHALRNTRQAKKFIIEGMSGTHTFIYERRLSQLSLDIREHATEQFTVLNTEYENREQVAITAERLYNQSDMIRYSVNDSPPTYDVPPLVFESEESAPSSPSPDRP